MLLSKSLYNIGLYFAKNQYQGLTLCLILTFIFSLGIVNIRMDVLFLFRPTPHTSGQTKKDAPTRINFFSKKNSELSSASTRSSSRTPLNLDPPRKRQICFKNTTQSRFQTSNRKQRARSMRSTLTPFLSTIYVTSPLPRKAVLSPVPSTTGRKIGPNCRMTPISRRPPCVSEMIPTLKCPVQTKMESPS